MDQREQLGHGQVYPENGNQHLDVARFE